MRAVGCRRSVKLHIFFIFHSSSSIKKIGSQVTTIRVGFGVQIAPILSCANVRFLLPYVITIHKRNRQTDRRTDVRTSCLCSISTTCYAIAAHVALKRAVHIHRRSRRDGIKRAVLLMLLLLLLLQLMPL